LKGKSIDTAFKLKKALKHDKCFLEGNATLLVNYFQLELKKKDVRVAFFGDNYLKDIRASYDFG